MQKSYYLLLAVMLIAGLIFLISGNRQKRKEGKETGKKALSNPQQENKYENLRKLAFSVKAEDLGYDDIGEGEVFAVISEMNMEGAIVTVTAFRDGTTSLYLSTGAVFIGAGEHEDVKPIVKEMVASSIDYLPKAKRVGSFDKPDFGQVIFNFRMPGGTARITANADDLESGDSEYSDLFYRLNDVITQIRLKSQQ